MISKSQKVNEISSSSSEEISKSKKKKMNKSITKRFKRKKLLLISEDSDEKENRKKKEEKENKKLFTRVYIRKHKGKIESGEIGIPMEESKLVLPCGIYGRWEQIQNKKVK